MSGAAWQRSSKLVRNIGARSGYGLGVDAFGGAGEHPVGALVDAGHGGGGVKGDLDVGPAHDGGDLCDAQPGALEDDLGAGRKGGPHCLDLLRHRLDLLYPEDGIAMDLLAVLPKACTAMGFGAMGFGAMGFCSDGICGDGVCGDGVWSDGVWSNGVCSNKVWSDGIWSSRTRQRW